MPIDPGGGERSVTAASWLTPRRLRAHGTILGLCLWMFYAWTLATPGLRDRNGNLKGTDFLHFYTLGSLANAHRGADLYDMQAQAALAAQRVPEAAGIRYLPLYPPQVSLLFAPLAHLSYGWALIVWWGCCAALYAVCAYATWCACPRLRDYGGLVIILAVAFPGFFHLIAWGQTSALALGFFTLMFFLLRGNRDFLAGLALGCLIFKPQLGLAAAVVFIATGAWRVLAGAALSAAAQISVGVACYGIEPLRQWIRMLTNVRTLWPLLEPKPYQTYSLATFWSMFLPWPRVALCLYVLSASAVLALTLTCWKRKNAPLAVRYSLLLLATVLVAPHLTIYDLTILAPALMMLADWLVAQSSEPSTRNLGAVLYGVYILPFAGPFLRGTHVQFAVIAMASAVVLIWMRLGRKPAPVADPQMASP